MDIDIDAILLGGAVVLIVAIGAARLGSRVGLPSLLLFLGLGLLMGSDGLGIPFNDAGLARRLGFARAGPDPGRGRADDQVERHQSPPPCWPVCWPPSASG